MIRRRTLECERRWAKVAGFAAIAILPLYIASTYLEGQTAIFDFEIATDRLRAIDAGATPILAASILRGIAFLLFIPALLYLFRAAQARSERVSPAMLGFVFIGPILFTAWVVISNVAQLGIASDFIAGSGRGGDIYTFLDDLADDSTLGGVGANLFFPAVLGILVALIYVPLQAMRVGLLTRFFATLGMALGASLILIAPQFSLLAIAIWFAWLGFLYLDRLPRGRPPAWAAGEAIPWPRPGEEPAHDERSAREAREAGAPESGNGVVEGDAQEIISPSAKDHSARRERARKKKRKRRR